MSNIAKSYSGFRQEDIQKLQIEIFGQSLFPKNITPSVPSEWLNMTLERNLRFPVTTEKAKSEFIVAPILGELHEKNLDGFTCFSGVTFDVDKSLGLKGRSDFILSRKSNAILLEAPIFSIIEAKNDGIEDAYPQCIAQLYAAELFNIQHNTPFPFVFGAVTTGFMWKFIRYENKKAYIDTDVFYMKNLSELLGVLQYIITLYK